MTSKLLFVMNSPRSSYCKNPLGFFFAFFLGTVCFDTFAGGLEVPDVGVVALGRGGAFTARADNPTAIHYNPAGLYKARGRNILIGASFMNLNLDFQRKGGDAYEFGPDHTVLNPTMDYSNVDQFNPTPQPFQSISGEHKLSAAPTLASTWGDFLYVKGLTVAMGLVTPSGFARPKFSKDGPGRYAAQGVNTMVGYSGIGVAYKINRYIQIGGMYQNCFFWMKAKVAIRPGLSENDTSQYNENLGGDAQQTIDVIDVITPTGTLGVMSHPLDWLEIGAAVKFPSLIEAEGSVSYDAPSDTYKNSGLVSGHDKAVFRTLFPWVVRTGVRFIHRYFDLEVNYVWENWGAFQGPRFEMDAEVSRDLDDSTAAKLWMPDTRVIKNFRDSHSIRLGSDIEVWPDNIAVRLGGYYQSSAYPKNYNTFSIDYPFGEQIGTGLGLTWHAHERLDINASYLHVFQFDVEVKEGIQQQIGMPAEGASGELNKKIGNTINNGSYAVNINMFALSLEIHI